MELFWLDLTSAHDPQRNVPAGDQRDAESAQRCGRLVEEDDPDQRGIDGADAPTRR